MAQLQQNDLESLIRKLPRRKPRGTGGPTSKVVDFIRHGPVDFPAVDEWDPTDHHKFQGAAIVPVTMRSNR